MLRENNELQERTTDQTIGNTLQNFVDWREAGTVKAQTKITTIVFILLFLSLRKIKHLSR